MKRTWRTLIVIGAVAAAPAAGAYDCLGTGGNAAQGFALDLFKDPKSSFKVSELVRGQKKFAARSGQTYAERVEELMRQFPEVPIEDARTFGELGDLLAPVPELRTLTTAGADAALASLGRYLETYAGRVSGGLGAEDALGVVGRRWFAVRGRASRSALDSVLGGLRERGLVPAKILAEDLVAAMKSMPSGEAVREFLASISRSGVTVQAWPELLGEAFAEGLAMLGPSAQASLVVDFCKAGACGPVLSGAALDRAVEAFSSSFRRYAGDRANRVGAELFPAVRRAFGSE